MKFLFTLLFAITSLSISCALLKSDNITNFIPKNSLVEVTKKDKKACEGKTITVAVIDTGFGYKGRGLGAKLCKYGHKDFTYGEYTGDFDTVDQVPLDVGGHGTNIVGLIDEQAKYSGVDYCIVVIKYHEGFNNDFGSAENEIRAIKYATAIGADFINISGGGMKYSQEETEAIKSFLDSGGHVIAAAGNEHVNLRKYKYYPAMSDPRVVIVGSVDKEGRISSFSNYGDSVRLWENGESAEAYGIYNTGTSQSTAIATGKVLAHLKNKCYNK
jgi:subtilisin family serine protease